MCPLREEKIMSERGGGGQEVICRVFRIKHWTLRIKSTCNE